MRVLIALLIILVSFGAYFGTLRHEFALDDLIQITNNQEIRVSKQEDLRNLFERPLFPGNLYRPVVMLSYAVTYQFAELDPYPYHLANIVLHTLVCLVLFSILARMFTSTFAGVASILFAVHPIHVEAVANVSGRAELLSAFFGLMAMGLVLASDRDPWEEGSIIADIICYFGLFIFTLLALFSKESAVSFLVLIPVVLITRRGLAEGLARSILPALIMAGALGIYIFFRSRALGGVALSPLEIDFLDNPLINLSHSERMLNAAVLLGRYIALILFPVQLASDYSFAKITAVTNWEDPAVLIDLSFLGLLVLCVLYGVLARRKYALWGLWFLLAFIATSNFIFPIGTIFAERLAYLPSIGILAFITWILFSVNFDLVAGVLLSFLSVLYVAQTLSYAEYWRDNQTLFQREISVSAASAKAQSNNAAVLRNMGKLDDAEAGYKRALKIYPEYADALFGLGTVYVMRENLSKAKEWFAAALSKDSSHPPSLILLGQIALNEGRNAEAQKHFLLVLEENPKSFDALLGILALHINLDEVEISVEVRDELLRRNPNHRELLRLNEVLEEKLKHR